MLQGKWSRSWLGQARREEGPVHLGERRLCSLLHRQLLAGRVAQCIQVMGCLFDFWRSLPAAWVPCRRTAGAAQESLAKARGQAGGLSCLVETQELGLEEGQEATWPAGLPFSASWCICETWWGVGAARRAGGFLQPDTPACLPCRSCLLIRPGTSP